MCAASPSHVALFEVDEPKGGEGRVPLGGGAVQVGECVAAVGPGGPFRGTVEKAILSRALR